MVTYEYPGANIPVIFGSALIALEVRQQDEVLLDCSRAYMFALCIQNLIKSVDSYIPTPEREIDKPFLMAVEDVFLN